MGEAGFQTVLDVYSRKALKKLLVHTLIHTCSTSLALTGGGFNGSQLNVRILLPYVPLSKGNYVGTRDTNAFWFLLFLHFWNSACFLGWTPNFE